MEGIAQTMPRSRDLWFETFVDGMGWELLEEYFAERFKEADLPVRIALNHESVREILSKPDHEDLARLVRHEFGRAYELAQRGTHELDIAYEKYGIKGRSGAMQIERAALLLVKHRDAFDFACALFGYHHSGRLVQHYALAIPQVPGFRGGLKDLKSDLATWLKANKVDTGFHSHLQVLGSEHVLAFTHADRAKVLTVWEKNGVRLGEFNPAQEDVLIYDPERELLRIDVRSPRLTDFYLEACCKRLAGDPWKRFETERVPVFSLGPIALGRFGSEGSTHVQKAVVRELTVTGVLGPGITTVVKSADVMADLAHSGSDVAGSPGSLTKVRIQFTIARGKSTTTNMVTIQPPHASDLPSVTHREVIEPYLRREGIMLR